MNTTAKRRTAMPLLPFDGQKLLFSASSYLAAMITLGIVLGFSLGWPWWALLTLYITAQPMSGAMRPKVLYRLAGIAAGGAVAILTVSNLQNAPVLLVGFLSCWVGLCLYFAMRDRTPRAFLFQMTGFSSAVLAFPYLDAPGDIFFSTIARMEEMTVAIVAVTLVHAVFKPWPVARMVQARARTFLRDASDWTADVTSENHGQLEEEHLRRLASDITELGIIALHLPYDSSGTVINRRLVWALRERLARLLSLASAVASRLALLRRANAVGDDVAELIAGATQWFKAPLDAPASTATTLAGKCRALSHAYDHMAGWHALLTASLCERMAECIEALHEARRLVSAFDGAGRHEHELVTNAPRRLHIERGATLAVLSGLAVTAALVLYCTLWIMLDWTSGFVTTAFASMITCSFAAQDDPAPHLMRYLAATLAMYPVVALYNFVILPCTDGYLLLVAVLAPVFLVLGYLQADPARTAYAPPMFASLIVGLGLHSRYQADFSVFMNTSCAQITGIVLTVMVARLFRSVGASWVARRMIRASWRDLESLATSQTPLEAGAWTSRAVDRLGQIAARMSQSGPGDLARDFTGLAELRVGRNLLYLRRAAGTATGDTKAAFAKVLEETAIFFRSRTRKHAVHPPPLSLLHAIDAALDHAGSIAHGRLHHQAVLALAGMRCNLFPAAPDYQPAHSS